MLLMLSAPPARGPSHTAVLPYLFRLAGVPGVPGAIVLTVSLTAPIVGVAASAYLWAQRNSKD